MLQHIRKLFFYNILNSVKTTKFLWNTLTVRLNVIY
jgi:hypothetical protein